MVSPNPDPGPLGDFLRDMLQQETVATDETLDFSANTHLFGMPPGTSAFNTGNYLDYQDLNLWGSNDIENWLGPDLTRVWHGSDNGQSLEGDVHDLQKSSEAFARSTWKWIPSNEIGAHDQINLATYPEQGPQNVNSNMQWTTPVLLERLNQKTRGRIVAMLLTVCDEGNYGDILSSFPAAVVLNALINNYLLSSERSGDDWIHVALRPSTSRPELLAGMIASGAVLSPSEGVQRFGYALQETTRLCLPKMFERNNRDIRNLQSLQAFTLCLDVGAWSGDRRVTEIAEGTLLLLVTMLRRGNYFRM